MAQVGPDARARQRPYGGVFLGRQMEKGILFISFLIKINR